MNRFWKNALITTACLYFGIAAYGSYSDAMRTDSTDRSKDERSGLRLHTDYQTGCQYLSSTRGGVFPRIDTDGVTQIGCGQS